MPCHFCYLHSFLRLGEHKIICVKIKAKGSLLLALFHIRSDANFGDKCCLCRDDYGYPGALRFPHSHVACRFQYNDDFSFIHKGMFRGRVGQ